MEKKTFKAFIDNAIAKGAEKIEIIRSKSICGIVNVGDIISVEAYKNGNVYRMALTHVFDDQPLLSCSFNGGDYIKHFIYSK